MKTECYKIKVTGKVQGVFFRKSTQEKARELQLQGWVRNEPDGSVYIEAEGGRASLDDLVKWAKDGPSSADVDNVDFERAEPKGYEKFEVRH